MEKVPGSVRVRVMLGPNRALTKKGEDVGALLLLLIVINKQQRAMIKLIMNRGRRDIIVLLKRETQ